MRRNKHDVMDTVPTGPGIVFDRKERDRFRKRVEEVIAKVETDVGSAHLFEPTSDVIRRQTLYDELRSEIASALFTEYLLFREHASTRLVLLGQLEMLEAGGKEDQRSEAIDGGRFEERFFEMAEGILKKIYGEVK